MNYDSFIERKSHSGASHGFSPVWMPDFLFDFQAALVEWAIVKGRAAIFADCGLGKTPMQLVWAENVARKTAGNVLILTPLAVAAQTIAQADRFGIVCSRSHDGTVRPGITLTNYERLHLHNPDDFAGVVCDESSILKSFDGARRTAICTFMRKVPYRLLATATAAPNDYVELGTSSEALGYLGHMDMLNRFFKNDQNTSDTRRKWAGPGGGAPKWRFKGHAERPFWRWVCSWARAIRKPSDIGFDDSAFVLPTLSEHENLVECDAPPNGWLFAMPATGLAEQRAERRRTVRERCGLIADMVNGSGRPALVWCHLNEEGAMLERLIPDAVQVSGSDSDAEKESRMMAFANGSARVLVTKPKIGAWGLNFQHCSHVTMFPSHSFEQYYQAVRRCWRFGQHSPVRVDIVTTEGERGVLRNMQRKAQQADRMFSSLVSEMTNELGIARQSPFSTQEALPSWL